MSFTSSSSISIPIQTGGATTSTNTNNDNAYRPDQELLDQVHSVMPPSEAHKFENIKRLAGAVSAHGHGFSFLPEKLMVTHTESINKFLAAARENKSLAEFDIRMTTVETIWGTMANPFGRSESYKGKKREEGYGYYVVFALRFPGRKYVCYSTHEIPTNTQLFPVAGNIDGLIQGRGPIDMAIVLDSLGRLTPDLKLSLYQEYCARWQRLDPSNLSDFERLPPMQQHTMTSVSQTSTAQDDDEAEETTTSSSSTTLKAPAKVVVPKGGWKTNTRGTTSRSQRSNKGNEKDLREMDELMQARRRQPTFTSDAFFGLD